jgi:hypothetical protein
MAKMIEKKALDFVEEIKLQCKKNGIWVEVTEKRKPDLEEIAVNFSIKIDKDVKK